MMFLIDDLNKNDKDYGQECKEHIMCVGPFKPKKPPPPPPPSEEEIEARQVLGMNKKIETFNARVEYDVFKRQPKNPRRQGLWARM